MLYFTGLVFIFKFSNIENKVSLEITEQAKQAIAEAIQTIKNNLPQLTNLNPLKRQEMLKMGDKTLAFVNKAYENALTHPELAPSYLDLAEMKKDLDAVKELTNIVRPLQVQLDLLKDTSMIAGSEGYAAALVFYNSVKSTYKTGVPAAKHYLTNCRSVL